MLFWVEGGEIVTARGPCVAFRGGYDHSHSANPQYRIVPPDKASDQFTSKID